MYANKRGLMLVEIMLVILIVAMLGAIAVALHLRAREKSQEVVCARNQQSIELAERHCVFEQGEPSATLRDLEHGGYLKKLELCPAAGDYAWVEYAVSSPLYHSTIACSIHGTGLAWGRGSAARAHAPR